MTTSNLPAPALQTLPVGENLLPVLDSDASCCGGSACGIG